MKEIILSVVALSVVMILGVLVIDTKSKVNYADIDCIVCGSNEVLDFGTSIDGQECHCADCGAEFTIIEK